MTVPSIKFNRRDNQLGIQTQGDWNQLAIIGNCVNGTVASNAPGKYSRTQDMLSGFGQGQLPECAVFLAQNFGIAPILCKADLTTQGAYQTINTTGVLGTSVVSNHTATKPYDEADIVIVFDVGAPVLGVAGAVYRYSIDDGLTFSPPQNLGTAMTITIAEVNAQYDFAAGSILAGDTVKSRTDAPLFNMTQLQAALTALQNTKLHWDGVLILGKVAGSDVSSIETAMVTMENAEMERAAMMNVRSPTRTAGVDETEAAYLTAQQTDFASVVAPHCYVGYGYERATSPIGFWQRRRPQAWGVAGRFATTRPGRDLAAVADGALPSTIQITDANGNPKEHDERIYPGADDSRFGTNRTWIGREGVYINNARLMSASGSDLIYMQFLRVSNLVMTILRAELQLIESADILVNPKTGFILEEEAQAIEAVLNFALKTSVVDTRDASAVTATVNRNDNLLSTFKLTGAADIVSLAYPKQIVWDIRFKNPVRNVVSVAQS